MMPTKFKISISEQRVVPVKIFKLKRSGLRGFRGPSLPAMWVRANNLNLEDSLLLSQAVDSGELVISVLGDLGDDNADQT